MRALRLAAALLPIAGLAGLWATSGLTYRQGTEWDVPIRGYDPRDLLRGHYVEFQYDWPGGETFAADGPQALCLEGRPPRVERVRMIAPGTVCPHPLRTDPASVYGTEALLRGRYYLGQSRAAALQAELQNRDRRGIVTIRQRADGSFAVVGIRFRPLTAEERAARDTPAAPIAPSAPPIMDEDEPR
ncbi:MAG: GDYXXLXY domain-containing protein [Erythrobacter sp.]